ncbi:hypothetical protein FJZ53_04275 [Candidatus Woesearchaeota archaeon]|nr:hypothetical protein [Candidatus Woesearchaeota archaeon]
MTLKYRKIISEVDSNHYFYLSDGRALKSLRELAEALEDMSEETFRHHVNSEKNDFANWIRDVITDEELAHSLVHIEDKEKILKKISHRLSKAERKLRKGIIHRLFRTSTNHEQEAGSAKTLQVPHPSAEQPKPEPAQQPAPQQQPAQEGPKTLKLLKGNIFKHLLLGIIIGSGVIVLLYLAYYLLRSYNGIKF